MGDSLWKPSLAPFRKFKKKVFEDIIKTTDFIYQIGEYDALRFPSRTIPVNKITSEEMKKKIEYLKKCMIKYRKLTGMGRGITAVQVGIPERFSVIYLPRKDSVQIHKDDMLIIINPKIIKRSEKRLRYPEVCMSANPIISPVVRPAWIECEYYNEEGKKKYWDTKDSDKSGRMYNRVFQHEIDHMDGIINIDRVKSNELIFESDPSYYETANFEEV